MKTYVTFGQSHRHEIGGVVFDKNCVAAIWCDSAKEGREKAFRLFGRKFCMEYHEDEFNKEDQMRFYHRGIIEVPE